MEIDAVRVLKFPRAVVARLVKRALPKEVQVTHETKVTISRAAAVFVLYVATTAQESARNRNRKIVQVRDVLDALHKMNCPELEKTVLEAVEHWKSSLAQSSNVMEKPEQEQASKEVTGESDDADATTHGIDESVEGVELDGGDPSDIAV